MTIVEEAQKQIDDEERNHLIFQAKNLIANRKKYQLFIGEVDALLKQVEEGKLVESVHAYDPNRCR